MTEGKRKKLLLLLLLPLQLFCQRPSTGVWLTAQFPLHISPHWQVPNDFNYRTLGNSANALQHLHRAGLKYTINENWSITSGAAVSFTRTFFVKSNTEFAREFRWWQELNYKRAIAKKLLAQLRLRTEERSFAATKTKTSYHAFRYRIKPQLQQMITNKWALLLADEYMRQQVNGKWSFDQNRLIVNGIYAVNTKIQLLAGYMWLRWPASSSQHILTVSFIKNIAANG